MRVLLATDGAAPSEHAVGLLAALARRDGVEVHVLSVNGFETAMHASAPTGHYSAEAGAEAARQAVDAAVASLRDAGLSKISGEVREGDEATEIVAVASDGHDLVVVGSGKERWIDTVALGSVSSSIVHAGPCPVLVAHEAPEPDRRVRVVIGADSSAGSQHAIAVFAGIADPPRCEVTVVTAVAPLALPPGDPASDAMLQADAADDAVHAARLHAGGVVSTLQAAGFDQVETVVEAGGPAPVLLDVADGVHGDLVVVGARGLGRFRAKMLGSVSDRVIRKARATLIGR